MDSATTRIDSCEMLLPIFCSFVSLLASFSFAAIVLNDNTKWLCDRIKLAVTNVSKNYQQQHQLYPRAINANDFISLPEA